jgi:Cu(I)/Ag(I) efflux system membrane fusion protein
MKRPVVPIVLGVVALVAIVVLRRPLVDWFAGPRSASSAAPATSSNAAGIDHWTCSMHPSVKQAGPGKCPICGMDLIPVTKADQSEGVVLVDDARRQLIGVKTAPVVMAPMRTTIRAVGRVTYDESALVDVSLKVKGWITKLFVTTTGQRVARGQPLFQLYSPDVYAAEQDFLVASRGGVEPIIDATRRRLHLLGLDDAQIDAVKVAGAAKENVTFPSPSSGYVIEKNVVEGASVEAGTRLYRIAALAKVWVEADVYEHDLPHVRAGQPARVMLDHVDGRAYDAKVSYVYPYVDDKTRSGRVRIELANADLELRPGMYAQVELATDLGDRLQVATSAVVYTGPRRIVFVDLGQGRLRPTEITIGAESNGLVEVKSGLHAGDVVATSGVFLIAAEARIRTATTYWEMPTEDAAAATPMPAPTPTAKKPAPPATIYTCPMHPDVHSTTPGKCPKCGMDLVPEKPR